MRAYMDRVPYRTRRNCYNNMISILNSIICWERGTKIIKNLWVRDTGDDGHPLFKSFLNNLKRLQHESSRYPP